MSSLDPKKPQDSGVLELEVTAWAAGGRGLGRVDGRVWMVPGLMPGDLARVVAAKDHGRWVEGRLASVVSPSPSRRVPPCPIQSECGGCPLMIAGEPQQRDAKRRFVADALARIGGLAELVVDPVEAPSPALAYRNKIELSFGRGPSGRRVLGYHRGDDPSRLVDVEACAIADPRLGEALGFARRFFLDGPGAGDPFLDRGRDPVRLVLRASGATPDLLIALRTGEGEFTSAGAFGRGAVAALPALAGVVRIVTPSGRRGGSRTETLAGRGFIDDEVAGVDLRVPAGTFLQVNPAAASAMVRSVLDAAGTPRRVLELYGGAGALGIALARGGAAAVIVDADADAVLCGREAAERAGIGGIRFAHEDVSRFLDAVPEAEAHPDLVLADPPRTGLGRGVAARIRALCAPDVVMISCDPATLARDLAALVGTGYRVRKVTPFDLFPQTAHVETVAWLTLRDQPPA